MLSAIPPLPPAGSCPLKSSHISYLNIQIISSSGLSAENFFFVNKVLRVCVFEPIRMIKSCD